MARTRFASLTFMLSLSLHLRTQPPVPQGSTTRRPMPRVRASVPLSYLWSSPQERGRRGARRAPRTTVFEADAGHAPCEFSHAATSSPSSSQYRSQ